MMNSPATGALAPEQSSASGTLEIPLVEGTFCAEDSRDCVLQMIADLQTYHRRRSFSHQERFGVPDPLSEQALDGLARAFDSAVSLVDDAAGNSLALTLESSIRVSVAPQ